MNRLTAGVTIFLLMTLNASAPAATVYVDVSNQSGTENGNSWATAYTKLWDALAHPGLASGDQIWVAVGTYKPGFSGRTLTFQVTVGALSLYGQIDSAETDICTNNTSTVTNCPCM